MPSSLDYPSQIIRHLGDKLAAVGTTRMGLPDRGAHDSPRRYLWVPETSPLEGARSMTGGRSVERTHLRFAVECWGWSFDDAWWMACALLTVMRRELKGVNYEATALEPWPEKRQHEGFVMFARVGLWLDLMSVDPSKPPATPKADPDKNALGPLPQPNPDGVPVYALPGQTTAVAESVGEATPATSTPGDGVIEGQET